MTFCLSCNPFLEPEMSMCCHFIDQMTDRKNIINYGDLGTEVID